MSPTATLENVEPTPTETLRAPVTDPWSMLGLHFTISHDEHAGVFVAVSAEVAAHAEGASAEEAVGALVDRLYELRSELDAEEDRLSDALRVELEVLRASLGG
jgi:hypothetical protein